MLLIAVLWAVYVSECFLRWRPGQWVFRRTPRRAFCGSDHPDITFWNERFAFAWTSAWPADISLRCSGEDTNPEACRARIEAVTRQTRPLRVSAAILFTVLLVLLPGLVLSEHLLVLVVPFAALAGIVWASTLILFFHTYSRVRGGRPPLETWLTQTLSPISLIASPAVIVADVVADMHPVTVAQVLCHDAEFLRIARLWYVDAPPARLDIRRLAASRGLVDALTAPPKTIDPGISHYCPRCHATYVGRAGTCVDCRGVALSPLQTAKPPLESSSRHDDSTTASRASGLHDVRIGARGHDDGRVRRRTRHTR